MKHTKKRSGLLAAVLAALPLIASAAGPFDTPFERVVIFGDSLSDPGNAYALTGYNIGAPYVSLIPDGPYAIGDNHFSNGPTWAEQMTESLNKPASGEPAFISGRPFANYAVGGARAGWGGSSPNLTQQVGVFFSHNPGLNLGASLIVLEFGGNDIRDALVAGNPGLLFDGVTATGDQIRILYAAGARHFLVVSPPDLAVTPAIRALGPAAVGAASALSGLYTAALNGMLAGLAVELGGVHFEQLDLAAELAPIVAAPASYGLTNATDPCLSLGVPDPAAVCASPDTYLFWDGIHPTTVVHTILAEAALDLIATELPPGLAVNP